MKVIVLGSGLIGTTSAYFLNKQGHDVTVIDRQPASGMETSFANGGQISVSHAEPWANPSAPKKIFSWLMKEDAPLLFRLRADARQWRWGLQFLRECTPARTRHNIIQIVNLGMYSRSTLQTLRAETGLEYDCLTKGILHYYTNQSEFDASIEPTRIMQEFGCDREIIDSKKAIEIEPALKGVQSKIVGATYTESDESGDAHKFTRRLSELSAINGVNFHYETAILGLNMEGGKISGVRVRTPQGQLKTLTADAYVLAMGSYSPMLVRDLGLDLLIYPAKGYSATLELERPELAPQVSLTDDEYKLVFSRLGNRLRIAGTAELNGYSTELNMVRCKAITRRTMEIFPGIADPEKALYWTGLRPATPSNVPYIGKSKISNLFLNTGHGTLGWTHSCGSGLAIADIISGKRPELDFAFCGMDAPVKALALT
jgi:D-amino-acid dehydrogenase